MKKLGKEEQKAARIQLAEEMSTGQLELIEVVRRMRRIAGKTQAEYAKMVGIAPRVLIDLERQVGNPTLATLNKIGAPFGFRVTYSRVLPKTK